MNRGWNSRTAFLVEVSRHKLEFLDSSFLLSYFRSTKCHSGIESSFLVADFIVYFYNQSRVWLSGTVKGIEQKTRVFLSN